MFFANKGATLMCTGCPGVPGKLAVTEVRTVKLSGNEQATEDDKTIEQPGFVTCLAIPTAPKKCSPQLGTWANTKSDVLIKGKKALMCPNTVPCTAGPGVITMIDPG